jgi:hypothetical protein
MEGNPILARANRHRFGSWLAGDERNGLLSTKHGWPRGHSRRRNLSATGTLGHTIEYHHNIGSAHINSPQQEAFVSSDRAGRVERSHSVGGYTSKEFQTVREALFACNNADRAYLRRWILRWVADYGHVRPEAEKMPEKGC